MVRFDDYVLDTLMRDLVGHDRRFASFLVYVWLVGEEQRRKAAVSISYSELSENIGISKSSAQAAVGWLLRRKLISARRASATATPAYTTQTPWKIDYRRGTH
ncbi:MAG: hypothetical protein WCC21_01070 [Candidatus Acidiferrales bacterium]